MSALCQKRTSQASQTCRHDDDQVFARIFQQLDVGYQGRADMAISRRAFSKLTLAENGPFGMNALDFVRDGPVMGVSFRVRADPN